VVFFGEGVVNVDMQCLVRCYRIYLFVFSVNAGTWDKEDDGNCWLRWDNTVKCRVQIEKRIYS